MRDWQKVQLEELGQSITEAHEEISKCLQESSFQTAMDILVACQEVAIQMGNLIEAAEVSASKAEHVTVGYLSTYCDSVYKLYEQISRTVNPNTDVLYGDLCNAWHEVERSLKDDIKVRKEIVFFPYKASMWDSLESIWLAAKEDERCDCYVVPIPYFDKKSDGTLGEMHYEGAEYPEYVPVVPWESYDVINRKPDVAYIHNPYDNGNYVTTVHPLYYAKELKKHVGKLVYCPYFVSNEMVGEHYCTLPGVLWADRVYVQSESIREQYIRNYDRVVSDHKLREVLGCGEDKIVALGSPKVDKIRFYDKNAEPLPEEWSRLCNGKKIVFYNTHLSEGIKSGECYLEKLKSVLAYFENSADYVLWWRPHPLSKEAMATMKPELVQKYEAIVNEYRAMKYGIYDDTPNWHRAVAWADVYYGSKSSLLPLFGITGKPIILQSVHKPDAELYEVFVKDGDMMYFLSGEMGALVSCNLKTEEWKLEAVLPWELQGEISVFSRMFVDGSKIYIFVVNSNAHFVYDIFERQFEKVELRINGVLPEADTNVKFAEVLAYKQYFILIPHRFGAILLYNKVTGEMTSHTEWIRELKNQLEDWREQEIYFRIRSVTLAEDKVFAVLRRENNDVICQFSAPDMHLEKVHIIPQAGVWQCLEYDGEKLWTIQNFGKAAVSWDYHSGEIQSYLNPSIKEELSCLQYRIVLVEDKIYLCPIKPNCTRLLLTEGHLIVNDTLNEYYQEGFLVSGDIVVTKLKDDGTIRLRDSEWNTMEAVTIQWPKEYKEQIYINQIFQRALEAISGKQDMRYFWENVAVPFEAWLVFLQQADIGKWSKLVGQKYSSQFMIASESAGSMIYDDVMRNQEDY